MLLLCDEETTTRTVKLSVPSSTLATHDETEAPPPASPGPTETTACHHEHSSSKTRAVAPQVVHRTSYDHPQHNLLMPGIKLSDQPSSDSRASCTDIERGASSSSRASRSRPRHDAATPTISLWSRRFNSSYSSIESTLGNSVEHVSRWRLVQRIKAALPATRKSKYSRTIGSIWIPDNDTSCIPRHCVEPVRSAVTCAVVGSMLLPLALLALFVTGSNLVVLAFTLTPWTDASKATAANTYASNTEATSTFDLSSTLLHSALHLSRDEKADASAAAALVDSDCRRAPPWISALFDAEVREAVDVYPMPAPVLGGTTEVSIGLLRIVISQLAFQELHLGHIELAACYDDPHEHPISLPLIVPPQRLLTITHNVSFTTTSMYEVYGPLGVSLGWGHNVVRGVGTVIVASDPHRLGRAVTSCDGTFDKMDVELHGIGNGIAPSDLTSIIDFGQLICKGAPDSLVSFSEEALPSGGHSFRGLPTEIDQIILDLAPKLHVVLRISLAVLGALVLAATLGFFSVRRKVERINQSLFSNRTLFGYYSKRWFGRKNAAALGCLARQCSVCAIFSLGLAITSLSYVYILTADLEPPPGNGSVVVPDPT